SDTGPLHLGTMCGARVIGWYFSRARVHETGPYGKGHFVWQHTAGAMKDSFDTPQHWPVRETVQLMQEDQELPAHYEWELWISQQDEWGTYYTRKPYSDDAAIERKGTWAALTQGAIKIDKPHKDTT